MAGSRAKAAVECLVDGEVYEIPPGHLDLIPEKP